MRAVLCSLPGVVECSAVVDLDELGRKCSRGKKWACNELAEISRDHEDVEVRMAAVRLIRNQQVLVEIAVGSGWDEEVRAIAAGSITKQHFLVNVAEWSTSEQVVRAAVDGIEDQRALARMAASRRNPLLSAAAFDRLTDQRELAAIASTNRDEDLALEAVERIGDTELLVLIARNQRSEYVRRVALQRIQGADRLIDLYRAGQVPGWLLHEAIEYMAFGGLEMNEAWQRCLGVLAQEDDDDWVRNGAAAVLAGRSGATWPKVSAHKKVKAPYDISSKGARLPPGPYELALDYRRNVRSPANPFDLSLVLKSGYCYYINPVVAYDRSQWTPKLIESECAASP